MATECGPEVASPILQSYPPNAVLRCACGYEHKGPQITTHMLAAKRNPEVRAVCLSAAPTLVRTLAPKESYSPPTDSNRAILDDLRQRQREHNIALHQQAQRRTRKSGGTPRRESLSPSPPPSPQERAAGIDQGLRFVFDNVRQETLDRYNYEVREHGYQGSPCDFFNDIVDAFYWLLGEDLVVLASGPRFQLTDDAAA